ncbi:hypothetical protein [Wolbachia endosymbiont (group A) of Sicus ferrugineus]|uniref:hypothetical protein n=1 Tax=Wolbachia endosymbiont (group A) of Sicus ferrugineus TaxID=2954056 RepID=UPI0022319FC7|nr:hypothetical protein [Wolbachia endosymbiont (group A) of Sicus ferrugineus]
MVFIINGECDMALSDRLSTIDIIENLTTNSDFLGKLITELSKGANNAGIYTKKGVDDELKRKADKNYVDTELGKKAGADDLANKANTADVYTKTAADTAFVKTDGSNISTQADKGKALADAILAVQDGNKSVLVDKLGGFLDENAKAYSNNTKTARELLVPSAAELVQDHDFKKGIEKSIKDMAVSSNPDFQKNVREVMSYPPLEIPDAADVPISADW